MNKFIADLKEVGRDIKSGVKFICLRCRQLPWWLGEVMRTERKADKSVIYPFTAMARDICRVVKED